MHETVNYKPIVWTRKAHTHAALCIILLSSRACIARHRRMSTQFRISLFSTTRYGNGIRRVSVRMYEPTQLYNQLSSRQYRFLPRTTLFNFGLVFSPLLYLFQRCARFFPRGHCLLCVQMPQFRNIFFYVGNVSRFQYVSFCPRDCCI